MKTYRVNIVRKEEAYVLVEASSPTEAKHIVMEEDFDIGDEINFCANDDSEWQVVSIEEDNEEDILRAMQAGGIEIEVEEE